MSSTVDYITLQQLKDALEVGVSSSQLDTVGPALITQASRALNGYCQRQITPAETNVVKTFEFNAGQYHIDLAPYDLVTSTLVRLYPESDSPVTLVKNDDYVERPVPAEHGVYTEIEVSYYIAVVNTRLFKFGQMLIEVTGNWGFPTVPDEAVRACIVACQSWLTRDFRAGYNVEAARDVIPGPAATYELPMAARRLMDTFRRTAGVV